MAGKKTSTNDLVPENPRTILACVAAACLAVAVILGIPYLMGMAKLAGWF